MLSKYLQSFAPVDMRCYESQFSSILLLVMFLQAENGADRVDWVNKITGVIASLLNSPFPGQVGLFIALIFF